MVVHMLEACEACGIGHPSHEYGILVMGIQNPYTIGDNPPMWILTFDHVTCGFSENIWGNPKSTYLASCSLH